MKLKITAAIALAQLTLLAGCSDATSLDNPVAPLSEKGIQELTQTDTQLDQEIILAASQCAQGDNACIGPKIAVSIDKIFNEAGYSMDKTIREVLEAKKIGQNAIIIQRLGFNDMLLGAYIAAETEEGRKFLLDNELLSQQTLTAMASN